MVFSNKSLFGIASLLWLVIACNSTVNRDGNEVKEIMKTQEIKKVSDADILNKALVIGNTLADSSQSALSQNLIKSIKTNGLSESIRFCRMVATTLTDSLSKKFGARIKRTSRKLRNPGNKPDQTERQILDAYQYSASNNIELKESVEMLSDKDAVLFTKPILISNPVCLNCHGTEGKSLSKENSQLIKSMYPEDSATNYKLNEFRGMWSILLNKKDLVNSL